MRKTSLIDRASHMKKKFHVGKKRRTSRVRKEGTEGLTSADIRTFVRLTAYFHGLSKKKGWWRKDNRNILEKIALIHSELSEAVEEYRKFKSNKDLRKIYYNLFSSKPEGFVVELADAVIRIFDLCGYLGLDLGNAIHVKHRYNVTRKSRHGGKRA